MDNEQSQNTSTTQQSQIPENGYINPSFLKKKESYTLVNVIALIFAVLLLIELFYPINACRYNCGTQITDLLFLPLFIFGFITGVSFAYRIIESSKGMNLAMRTLHIIIGLLGFAFILIVSFFSGLIGGIRTHPT